MKLRVTVQQILLQNGTAVVDVDNNTYMAILANLGDVEWHEPHLAPNTVTSVIEAEEVMEIGELTQAEIDAVFRMRAMGIARQANDNAYRHTWDWAGKLNYFWPMGAQPDDSILRTIADKNIVIAARKYALWTKKEGT